MQRLKILVWIGAGILVVGALGNLFATQVVAQVRAALVRDFDGPIRGIRQIENTTITFNAGNFSEVLTITPTIPPGKKLFLQRAFLHALLTDDQALMEARVTINPGPIGLSWFDMERQAAGNVQTHYTGDIELGVVLNAGETIDVFLFRNNNLGSSSLNFARVSLYGYLVDITP